VASVPVMKPGDLWLLGEQRTLCGDALAPQGYTRLLGDERTQKVFTGQPWYIPIAGHSWGPGVVKRTGPKCALEESLRNGDLYRVARIMHVVPLGT
jgi:hypothetical protein